MRRLAPLVLVILLLVSLTALRPGCDEAPPEPAPPPASPPEPAPDADAVPPRLSDAASGSTADDPNPERPERQAMPVDPESEIFEVPIGGGGWITVAGDAIELAPPLEGGTVRYRIDGGGGNCPPGTVTMSTIEPGRHEYEVSVEKDGVLVRKKGVLVATGDEEATIPHLSLEPGAGIRARVLDADGVPVLQACVVVARPEEEPEGAHRVKPGKDGWIAVLDLEPGVYHRVVALGLPVPIERSVRVPPEPKGVATEEIRIDDRTVPVKLRFEIPGEGGAFVMVPPNTVTVRLPATGIEWPTWPEPGGRLLPGEYEFTAVSLGMHATLVVSPGRPVDTTLRLEAGSAPR